MYEIFTPSSCLDAAFALRVPSATTVTMATDAMAICKDETFIVVFMLAENYYQKWLWQLVLCVGVVEWYGEMCK
jgi:hypothetical protein